MFGWLTSLFLLCAYLVLSPWFAYRAIFKGKRCGNWRHRFFGQVPTQQSNCIWFHAVSVGEVNLLQPLIDRLQQQNSTAKIVISTTTRTGFELAEKKYPTLTTFYAPIDFVWSINLALRRLNPKMIVLSELELWPNLISLAHKKNIPLAVINGRMSDKSFRGYQRVQFLLHPVFQKISMVCAQSKEYADRFIELGVPESRVFETGSIKFDGARTNRQTDKVELLKKLANIQASDRVFLAGSTQPGEELMAASVYQNLKKQFPELRLIVVPRHVERAAQILAELQTLNLEIRLRSELSDNSSAAPMSADEVLLVDTIGELSDWWATSHIGFVGGSFGNRGGQNMIEPAALGVATCFGPNTWNFKHVVRQMLAKSVAREVQDNQEMESFVMKCLADENWAKELGTAAKTFIRSQQGSADKTISHLFQLLGSSKEKGNCQADKRAA